ncbi:MAG: hypothetical protein ABWY06_12120 [Pseudomonas sp.]|uniref:hypothetical protein n=1 Tax=Pseudomonas sp. TaxID=306 RepID=UPI00339ACF95
MRTTFLLLLGGLIAGPVLAETLCGTPSTPTSGPVQTCDSESGAPIVQVYPYQLDLKPGFWVERSGEPGDKLTLVVQRDGQTVLERNAAGNLRDRYWDNRVGSHYQLWLKAFRNGAYEVVSNRISYRPGITDSVGLLRQTDGSIKATVPFTGDWVVERNGQPELRQPALDGVPLQFPFLFGERYRVWVESTGAAAQPLSIPLAFRQGFPEPFIDLQVEGDFSLSCTCGSTPALSWVIEENGAKVYEQPTGGQALLRYPFAQGKKYKVWLNQALAGEQVRMSDAEYFSPGLTDSFQLQVSGGQISRSGAIGDPLTWVIEVNGDVVLRRNVANELQYSHGAASYRAWLTRFVDGYYQRVSNQVRVGAVVAPQPYQLAVDASGTLTRSGVLGEPLWWLIEQDGVVVLRRMATNELSYRYTYHAGKRYRLWLEKSSNGGYQRVSSVLEHTGIEQYQISSDGKGRLTRSGAIGDRVQWIIEEDGKVVMRRLASGELSYFDFSFDPTRTYRAWIQSENAYHPISTAVSYGGPPAQAYQLSIGSDRLMTRTVGSTPGLQWVIEEGGVVVSRVSTERQLVYRYPSYYPGKVYRVWLEALVGGVQRPVSAVLTY